MTGPDETQERDWPAVSYVMPILNEQDTLADAVHAVLSQEYPAEAEIILSIGPCTDGTHRIADDLAAHDPRVRIVDNPQGDIPTGLNLAIDSSRHNIVVRVDAHTELPAGYTRGAVAALFANDAANLGGLMSARGRTPFQQSVARAYNSPLGLGSGVYHHGDTPGPADSAYLGVFRREVLREVGGYDTSLKRGEDWELNLRIREAGHVVWFEPSLRVTYWPRATWTSLRRQMFATGVWRGDLVRRQRRSPVRYLVAPGLVLSLVASAVVALVQAAGVVPGAASRLLGVVYLGPLSYLVFLAVGAGRLGGETLAAKTRDGAVLATIHLAWGAGFLKGITLGARDTVDRSRVKADAAAGGRPRARRPDRHPEG